jgi:hypothetical protein
LSKKREKIDVLNGQVPQHTVGSGSWFGSEVKELNSFSLVSCTVSPGFDFADFEMGNRQKISKEFPDYLSLIKKLL